MNVLSLFDGMSCGQIALQRVGINVTNYFASEIDKYAMSVAKLNYPNTNHIGNVLDVKGGGATTNRFINWRLTMPRL